MADEYDVIVIGGGLGGLTAAALLAQAGRKTLLIERNHDVGGAASTYKTGELVVEASLHETSDPKDSIDPKHHVLARLGVLDQVEWVPTGAVYEVRGGPIGEPFVLPDGFAQARRALLERFPSGRAGIASVRSPNTPIPGLYLASSYAGSGGFTGAILAGAAAAKTILASRGTTVRAAV